MYKGSERAAVNMRDIIRMILAILGIIMLCWFILPTFITHGVNIGTLTGVGLGLAALFYGIWMRQINSFICTAWHTVPGKIAEIFLLIICASILTLAIMCSVCMISACTTGKLSGSSDSPDKDMTAVTDTGIVLDSANADLNDPDENRTVIVLGARVYENRLSTALKYRLDAAYEYLIDHPLSACIVTGGQGVNEPCTEASLMYAYLAELGIDEGRIYVEDESTDTVENIQYSIKIIRENNLNDNVAIVTSDYHVYRSLTYAARDGLDAVGVASATQWWIYPVSVVREMYGILEQWFLNQ